MIADISLSQIRYAFPVIEVVTNYALSKGVLKPQCQRLGWRKVIPSNNTKNSLVEITKSEYKSVNRGYVVADGAKVCGKESEETRKLGPGLRCLTTSRFA